MCGRLATARIREDTAHLPPGRRLASRRDRAVARLLLAAFGNSDYRRDTAHGVAPCQTRAATRRDAPIRRRARLSLLLQVVPRSRRPDVGGARALEHLPEVPARG